MSEAKKVTTIGPCVLCGSGSCAVWKHAELTDAGIVDHAALHLAHAVAPDEVKHNEKGDPIEGGADPIVPMAHHETATFKRHGGRTAPIPPPWRGRRRH